MEHMDNQLIGIPIEFRVACKFYRVQVQEVLQIFIDHVSIFDLISKSYHEGFTDACLTILSYTKTRVGEPSKGNGMEGCKELFCRNMDQIERIATITNTGIKTSKKREYTRAFVNNIFLAMERIYSPSNTIYIDANTILNLNPDICLLCEIYHCRPKEILLYFMNQISLAEAHILEGTNRTPNFMYGFFFKIANGFARKISTLRFLSDEDVNLYHLMNQIRLDTYIIRDQQKRIDTLRSRYLYYYNSPNIN